MSFRSAFVVRGRLEEGRDIIFNCPQPLRPREVHGVTVRGVCERPFIARGVELLVVAGERIQVATLERAIIDALALPRADGGLIAAARLLAGQRQHLAIDRLCALADSLDWPSAERRLGYLLERLGVRAPELEELRQRLTVSWLPLDPDRARRAWRNESRWKLNLKHDEPALARALALA